MNPGTITSSPGPTPSPTKARYSALVPEFTPRAYLTPTRSATCCSKRRTLAGNPSSGPYRASCLLSRTSRISESSASPTSSSPGPGILNLPRHTGTPADEHRPRLSSDRRERCGCASHAHVRPLPARGLTMSQRYCIVRVTKHPCGAGSDVIRPPEGIKHRKPRRQGGKMAHVSDPRQGGGGGGPEGQTGCGRFSRPRRRRIGVGATVILGPPPTAPVPPGGTSPTTRPRKARENPCKGVLSIASYSQNGWACPPANPAGLALGIGIRGQLPDASTS